MNTRPKEARLVSSTVGYKFKRDIIAIDNLFAEKPMSLQSLKYKEQAYRNVLSKYGFEDVKWSLEATDGSVRFVLMEVIDDKRLKALDNHD